MSHLAPFLRYSKILAKNCRSEPTPTLFGALLGLILWSVAEIYGVRKLRVPGLSYSVVNVILGLAVFVQLRLVTDGRTDGQTMTSHTTLA